MSSQTPTNTNVMAELRKLVGEDPREGWDKAWMSKMTPWDFGDVQPALKELLESGDVPFPRSGHALVPGCGRGYDAIFIASVLVLSTLGVDISKTAIVAANELLSDSGLISSASVKFELKDFFGTVFKHEGGDQFDLVYDYTFFVAIQPSLRSEWGKRMSTLVRHGGYLITLIYPLDPPQDYGPPFYVRPEHYVEVLGEGWDKVWDKIPTKSSETHKNRERMVVWRRV